MEREIKLVGAFLHGTHDLSLNVDTLKLRCAGCRLIVDVLAGGPDITDRSFAGPCPAFHGRELPGTGVVVTVTGTYTDGSGRDSEDPSDDEYQFLLPGLNM